MYGTQAVQCSLLWSAWALSASILCCAWFSLLILLLTAVLQVLQASSQGCKLDVLLQYRLCLSALILYMSDLGGSADFDFSHANAVTMPAGYKATSSACCVY